MLEGNNDYPIIILWELKLFEMMENSNNLAEISVKSWIMLKKCARPKKIVWQHKDSSQIYNFWKWQKTMPTCSASVKVKIYYIHQCCGSKNLGGSGSEVKKNMDPDLTNGLQCCTENGHQKAWEIMKNSPLEFFFKVLFSSFCLSM